MKIVIMALYFGGLRLRLYIIQTPNNQNILIVKSTPPRILSRIRRYTSIINVSTLNSLL